MRSETTVDIEPSPAPSGTTQRLERRALVEQLLVEVRQSVERRAESGDRRKLLGTLRRLDTVVARWSALPPTKDQLSAMLDVLQSLKDSEARSHPA